MNRTIILTTAALAAAFVHPLPASAHGGNFGGGGGHSGGGGGRSGGGASMHVQQMPHVASHVQQAPHMAFHAQQMPRAATQAQSFALRNSAQPMRTPSQANPRAVVTNRSFNNRPAPTIAFGGSAPNNVDRNANIRNNATANARTFSRSDFRSPPADFSRNWDRGQIHNWNHHRYRWFNNGWIILDGGYYGDPYFYDYGYAPGYTNDYDSTPYDNSTAALPFEYSTTDRLASSVQEELVRKGYNPGAVDGVIGPQTRNAIAQFQTDHRLSVTGRIDRSLLSAMGL